MKIDIPIPDGECGRWKIETFNVSKKEADLYNLRCSLKAGMCGRGIEEGTYKKLMRDNYLIMSNTPAEIDDHSYFIRNAKGDVLINGLGLGVCIFGLLQENNINSITVIEIAEEVVKLVGTYITDSRVTIINTDALSYQPPKNKRYHSVWHDIWDDICVDNLNDMHKLHRKYGKKTNWQGSWCRELCEMYK